MNAQDLKNSILQLAVQGKLVKQRVEEEPAIALINRIRDKQEKMLKNKEIKKEKYNKEVDYTNRLPLGWEYVKVGELTSVVTKQTGFDYSKTIKPNLVEARLNNTIPLIQTKNFKGKEFNFDTDYFISMEIASQFPKIILDSKCMLLSIVGASIGNVGIYNYPELAMIGGAICKVKFLNDEIYDYIFYFLQSPYGQKEIRKNYKSTAQGTITVQDVREIVIPMPPIEEQRRILAKIEELMPNVERYGVAYSKLEVLNKKFPEDMRKSIVQYALQGKLVEQQDEEGTAEELYQQIQEEKEKLIKEGKIKKQKPLPKITEEEIPFKIPESWKWVRLGDITHNWGQKKPEKLFDYIDVGSIDNISGTLSKYENLIEAKDAPSRARKIVKEGTVLYSTVRPYLLNICIIDKKFEHEPIASTAFAVLHPFKGLFEKYLYFVLRSPMFIAYVSSVMIGVAYPAINDANLLAGLIPLPPLEEQKRIVAKIEELMPYTKQLVK